MIEVAPLKFGAVFKQAFSQVEVFTQFVKDVLEIEINIDKVHTEYEYPKPIGFVRSKYDLFAEDIEKRVVVEIQHIKQEDFFDRFLYYHIISLAEQIGTYQEYYFEKTVYTIVVLTSLPRDQSIQFSWGLCDFNLLDEHGRRHAIYPHRLLFLCPRLVNEKTPTQTKRWLELIEDSLDGKLEENNYTETHFKAILNSIYRPNIDRDLLAQIKDEAAWENVKRQEREAGEKQARLETARKMLQKGFTLTEIADLTGLSYNELSDLS